MKREILDALRAARRGRSSLALTTELNTGAQTLEPAGQAKTGVEAIGNSDIFTHVFEPAPRLILVGAVHIAQKLVPLARLAEFTVHVVDPRGAFASVERFPDVDLSLDWPDKAVAGLSPDSATAVYVGALGSRKTHGRRVERLRAEGFGDAEIARIHAPVGLPIGGISPGEIAVSIMAEIIAARRGRRLEAAGA